MVLGVPVLFGCACAVPKSERSVSYLNELPPELRSLNAPGLLEYPAENNEPFEFSTAHNTLHPRPHSYEKTRKISSFISASFSLSGDRETRINPAKE